ncbi:glycosyl hydrolases family 18 protein, partial [Phlyctema vagabunda]
PLDYSVKPARLPNAPVCEAPLSSLNPIFGRQVTQEDDFSCSESKPCRNGACCPKETGWCNYGPKACGTNGISPNEVCWSNCDAKADCGRFAEDPKQECPLNVCCGPWGFCGMTDEFCTVTDDDETSCQSNCEQPGSGSSGGDVRKRVIGYYEAWVHTRKCNGMSISDIPVGALTHLVFSFAYITPGTFNIAPMDDLPSNLFSTFTALKRRNTALKVMVAIGGWTFNDPGPTQTVFSDVSSSKANRQKFITNLLSFMRQYGFDGVDFDWEYPGAEDRGGKEDDGVKFTALLEELREAIKSQPVKYEVSFTTPTSFWYLRHFDLKASTDAVDFVNIMSYDLHGVWDAWNPIGSRVLGHSNITEIELALDLYWRNDIPPEKLNLGIGFYGRSFQLSDPTCYKPGCAFKGGAAPGPCTANSGTLAYREIVDIVKEKNLKPYYDKKAQVKYVVWNQDQWISYDDEETIKAKIDFANKLGLGGLLIWSIDQDTDDLQALTAVVGSDVVALAMTDEGKDAAYWQTFAGTFLSDIADFAMFAGIVGNVLSDLLNDLDMSLQELYCCPPDTLERWTNCEWKGKPGSCFDNQCDLNTQVQMATNRYGLGQSCSPQLSRARVFCCDPPDGEPLFPPVPLKDLFENPPEGDDVDTQFDLLVDNTWGDGEADTGDDDDPNDAAFGFYVMASPDEIQTSLNKRDGSHWELFNCNNATSEEEQTVQMICTDISENSTCHHISRGDGVPGTILEMPQGQGCGPGKYSVAKSMTVSKDQSLPHHLYKRNFAHKPVVYDLTFDYRFDRVSRAFGDTQLRVDYSNQKGYWDSVVAKPIDKKRKRSLDEFHGSHKRWLEEEWRDDFHFGGLSRDELHKRWFGEDVISWLKGLLNTAISPSIRHDYEEEVSAIILQEEWECGINPETKFFAKVDAIATASIKMSTSFGLTLVTTLGPTLDLSKSFLHFNNAGEISAVFTLEALAKVDFDSKDFTLATLPLPGASFRVPGVMTIGPHFNLDARVKAGIAISGSVEARVEIASWEIRQTYPEENGDYKPKSLDDPQRNIDASGLKEPQFDAAVQASGYMEAHLMPTLSFGLEFDKQWKVPKCTAELVADGWVRLRAKSDIVGGDCSFAYAVDAGAALIARANAPDSFGWKPQPLSIGTIDRTLIPDDGSEWKCLTDSVASNRRATNTLQDPEVSSLNKSSSNLLKKRLVPYGPIFRLPPIDSLCPTKGGSPNVGSCSEIFAVDGTDDSDDFLLKRDFSPSSEIVDDDENLIIKPHEDLHWIDGHDTLGPRSFELDSDLHWLERRLSKPPMGVCVTNNEMTVRFPNYPEATVIYDNADWADCNNYDFGIQTAAQVVPRPQGSTTPTERYITEHVLEAQMLKVFMQKNYEKKGDANSVCAQMAKGGWKKGSVPINGVGQNPWSFVATGYPSSDANSAEMMIIIEPVNLLKERAFKGTALVSAKKMADAVKSETTVHSAIRSMKHVLLTYKYMALPEISTIYVDQIERVETNFNTAEDALKAADSSYTKHNLGDQWKTWSRGYTSFVIKRFDDFINLWMPQIEKVLENTDSTQDDAGRAELRTKIETLKQALEDASGTWTNPL